MGVLWYVEWRDMGLQWGLSSIRSSHDMRSLGKTHANLWMVNSPVADRQYGEEWLWIHIMVEQR